MGDKIHIRERNHSENQNKQMEKRGWTGGKVFKTILMLLFSGIIGGVVYIVMTNNILKQKNRMVEDHNDKIPKDVNNKKAEISKETVNEKKKEKEKSVG